VLCIVSRVDESLVGCSIRGFIYDVDTGLLSEVFDGPKGPGI
jgi:hypothetical protein